jgi:hypothetical protein
MMAEPDEERGEGKVEDHLVEERRLEGAVLQIRRRDPGVDPGRLADLDGPRQSARLAEQLLVEVVADAPDGLGDQQRGRDGVHERADVRPGAAQPPDARHRAGGDPTPDAEPALPYRQRAPPGVRRDVERGGDVEVDPRADEPGGYRPDEDVVDQGAVTAGRDPAPGGDVDRERDPDHVHQPVDVEEQRAQVDAVVRWTRDERQRRSHDI